jgi:NAD(P)H-flavin reductase/ferredoxin
MSVKVPVQFVFSDGRSSSIQVERGASVLAACKEAGISLLVDCEEGVCGTCQGRASCGSLDMEPFTEGLLSASEINDGFVLVCRTRATGPVVIELPYSSRDAQVEGDETPTTATVVNVQEASRETMTLTLETQGPFAFLPGQYVNISPHPGLERSFSMANAPDATTLVFHIALRSDGKFCNWLRAAPPGATVQLSPARGTFFLRDDLRPKVMVAGGTGLAPFLAMLRSLAAGSGPQRSASVTLLVGARSERHLFEKAALDALRVELPGLDVRYACDEVAEGSPTRQGRVTDMLGEIELDRAATVYVCGPPPMVEAARQALKSRQFPLKQFLAEKFTG